MKDSESTGGEVRLERTVRPLGWGRWFALECQRFFYSFMAHWHAERIRKCRRFSEEQKYHFRRLLHFNHLRKELGMIRTA